MTYKQELRDAFMGGGILYKYIEDNWGIRLGGAEKMLLRQSLESVWEGDGNPIPTCLYTLQYFRFNSVLLKGRLARVGQSTIKEYERAGRVNGR